MSTADDVFGILRSILPAAAADPQLETELRKISVTLSEVFIPERSLPEANETVAVAIRNPKTAALCFDRIWGGLASDAPREISVFGDTDLELRLLIPYMVRTAPQELARLCEVSDSLFTHDNLLEMTKSMATTVKGHGVLSEIAATRSLSPLSRVYAAAISRESNASVVPVYSSISKRDAEYKPGDRTALVTILSGLDVVDEDRLTWEQVIEMRTDRDARRRYVRFLHWLDKDMMGKSLEFVEDEINTRLEDYVKAIRKHGLVTVIGTCSAILDPRTIASAASAYGAFAMFSHDMAAAVAGGSIVLARGAVHIAQQLLNLDDVRRAQPEVAFVYELGQQSM